MTEMEMEKNSRTIYYFTSETPPNRPFVNQKLLKENTALFPMTEITKRNRNVPFRLEFEKDIAKKRD